MARDPRIDPRPGDVIRNGSQEIEVIGTSHGIIKFRNTKGGAMGAFHLQEFRRWASTFWLLADDLADLWRAE